MVMVTVHGDGDSHRIEAESSVVSFKDMAGN